MMIEKGAYCPLFYDFGLNSVELNIEHVVATIGRPPFFQMEENIVGAHSVRPITNKPPRRGTEITER